MKTIKYQFVPLEERSNDELSQLYGAICIGYFDVNTDEDRQQVLGVLAEKWGFMLLPILSGVYSDGEASGKSDR